MHIIELILMELTWSDHCWYSVKHFYEHGVYFFMWRHLRLDEYHHKFIVSWSINHLTTFFFNNIPFQTLNRLWTSKLDFQLQKCVHIFIRNSALFLTHFYPYICLYLVQILCLYHNDTKLCAPCCCIKLYPWKKKTTWLFLSWR